MTHDEMIAVIQAHKDGKAIEFRYDGEWKTCQDNNPLWNFTNNFYRVKPEPRVRWAVYSSDGRILTTFSSEEKAKETVAIKIYRGTVVKFVEEL